MRALTVFQAYTKARQMMEDAAYFRKEEWGISVGKDRWAREWQKRKRQADLLEAWLTRFLEGLE